MTTPSQRPAPRRVEFESDEFGDLARLVEERLDARQSLGIVFLGGVMEQWRQAISVLEEGPQPSVHQYNAAHLVDARHNRDIEVQANIREVFDRAGHEPSLLVFVNGDALFDAATDRAAAADAITPADYFLQRVAAFEGISVVCVTREDVFERDGASALEFVVLF